MTTSLRISLLLWSSLAVLLLSGCSTPSSAIHTRDDSEQDEALVCEAPDADQCVVLACDGEWCGIFDCEDVEPVSVSHVPLEQSVQLVRGYRPPMRAPGPRPNWRRTGLRSDAQPRMTFHFRYRQGYLPAFPRLEGRLVRHHLFPQAKEFRDWFRAAGVDIHEWTMIIPEHLHRRIHSGARGGLWNEAWRRFREDNRDREVTRDEMIRKAFELAFRFDIVGPIMPYDAPIRPAGPQLLAP